MEQDRPDTLELAEGMKQAYANHYVGTGKPRVLRDIVDRYHETDSEATIDESLTSFMRTRGPYLQALDLPREGPQWDDFAHDIGLHQDIVRTFNKAGFDHLYQFQSETIRQILGGDHTLVTAGTGRGKTESWLVPILQFICEAKAGDRPGYPPESVKCLLTYPTKALAQDQLKRLIGYLHELNQTRSGANRITVGIFDGDTPSNDPDELDYLSTVFRFFECPCDRCGASLTVERTEDERFRVTHDTDATPDPGLGFIQLTRDAIREEGADILLTNPDTVNYRLFNVNGEKEQSIFVTEPKYVVFDEIHEYSELFGAYTATLMRRYVRSRQELRNLDSIADDSLQLIGASATVENREAIFNRINPFVDPDTSIVTEDPQTMPAGASESVPTVFTRDVLDESGLLEALSGETKPGPVGEAILERTSMQVGEATGTADARQCIEDTLYTRLLTRQDDGFDWIRNLYQLLYETPKEPDDLVTEIKSEFSLTQAAAETVLSNFIVVGRLSGILESRAHLFSWPIDGYYTCLGCATVYETPQASCRECGDTFVTKLSYCTHCGEEALESWFCPDCERLTPLTVTSHEGRFEYFETQSCPCGTEMIQTMWRPFYECRECGYRGKVDRVQECPECDGSTPLVLSNDRSQYRCTNPECDVTQDTGATLFCDSCRSDSLEPLTDDLQYCTECEEVYEGPGVDQCSCGNELEPRRLLGWQCRDRDCDTVYFGEPPQTCSCGNRRFARTGLFDVTRVEHCGSCDRDLFPGQHCFCDEPNEHTAVRGFTQYKLVDERGQVRSPTDFPGAVPCYDRRKSYDKSKRYNSMLRGPGNTAVTTSQYLLRTVADRDEPESFSRAKLLSFADSQSDMKQLARDFNEPEERLFFTQLVVEQLSEGSETWRSLADIQAGVVDAAQAYEADLQTELDANTSPVLGRLTRYDQSTEEYVKEEATARILSGRFNERRTSYLRLAKEGLVNVRLSVDVDSLEETKRTILESFQNQSRRYVSSLSEEVSGAGHHVDELVEMGILERRDAESGLLVGLDPNAVECALVDDDTPIGYDSTDGRFYTKFDLACSPEMETETLVDFTADYRSRADVTHTHFTLTAFRVATSDPMRLLGTAYFGGTERKDRRRIEYQFREGRHPHFLSSGPAMELGVDIGDLNSLLLYGTPPNMNSYLQRVGRAGRQSGSSLVHSVSQRNPIDYYYFEQPGELIQADSQPVPLNELNENVLERSLTWALLDCIAATQWVPIRRETSALRDALVYEETDEPTPRTEPRPNDIETFSTLLANSCAQLQPGASISPLEGIRDAVEARSTDAREWLRDLLRFDHCDRCGRKHDEGHDGSCTADGCEGTTLSTLERHGHLVDEVLEQFEPALLDSYVDFEDELFAELDQLEEEVSDARRGARRRRRGDKSGPDEQERLERLRNRRTQLDEYLQRLEEQSYGDFLSTHSDIDFSLRSVSDSVTYDLVGSGFEQATTDALDRDIQIALSELHPGAAYLHSDNETYVVTELTEDSYETSQIRDSVADEAICPTCGTVHDIDSSQCETCGTALKRLRTIVPSRVRAYKHDLPVGTLPNGTSLTPDAIYRGDGEIQSTYAPVDREVVEFNPSEDRTFAIVDSDGTRLGTFAHGSLQIRATANQFYASYESGGSDPLPTIFERCGVENCDGFIVQTDDQSYCVRDPQHDVDDSVAVQLAAEFETDGVRVQLDREELEHTLAHGLRVALQYIGGVGVRKVPEAIEDDGTYVYDGDEGGSGITVLLSEGAGESSSNFQQALDIIEETFNCECDGGCPFCLFQFGCTEHNDPDSFDKSAFSRLVTDRIQLVPLNEQ
jgi:ATP-dependent helicase YprA (DUF1998 family)